jgi:hypothetical protein
MQKALYSSISWLNSGFEVEQVTINFLKEVRAQLFFL